MSEHAAHYETSRDRHLLGPGPKRILSLDGGGVRGAITVAFLGRLNPIGILIAALVVALTFIGGESAQIMLKLPLDLTQAFQGILLLCVLAADALVSYRIRFVTRGGGK